MNLTLIGMPGCGKSTIGIVLAKAIGYSFIDTDLIIQNREGKLLQQIINDNGSACFLNAEESALLSVSADNTVISTGGSAVFSQKGMEHLKHNGITIFINVSLPNIEKRLQNIKTRGIAGAESQSIEEIYNKRMPLYEKYADYIIDCDSLDISTNMAKIKACLPDNLYV